MLDLVFFNDYPAIQNLQMSFRQTLRLVWNTNNFPILSYYPKTTDLKAQ